MIHGGNVALTGPFHETGSVQHINALTSNNGIGAYFNANRCSKIYGNSTTVQPNSYTVRKIIKY